MCRDRGRVGLLLDAHQLEIGAIGKTRQRHLRGMVRVRAAVFGRDARSLAKGLAHLVEMRAGESDVIDFQVGAE